jgi:hypothetical protein
MNVDFGLKTDEEVMPLQWKCRATWKRTMTLTNPMTMTLPRE